MSAFFCLFLCFRSYSEKLEVYTPTYYKIRYILDELYVAVLWIISWLIKHDTSWVFFYQKRQLLTKKIRICSYRIRCFIWWTSYVQLQRDTEKPMNEEALLDRQASWLTSQKGLKACWWHLQGRPEILREISRFPFSNWQQRLPTDAII